MTATLLMLMRRYCCVKSRRMRRRDWPLVVTFTGVRAGDSRGGARDGAAAEASDADGLLSSCHCSDDARRLRRRRRR